jgi:putative membrane protein
VNWGFLAPWDASPALMLVLAAAAVWYWRAGRRQGATTTAARWSFYAGLACIWLVLQTDFDYYAQHAFFMHRLQHMLLHHLAPFLLALGMPAAALAAWPSVLAGRRRAWPLPYGLLRAACHPLLTAALFNLLVLFWLIPAVHLPAMLDWRLYRVMNWSVAINAFLFWTLVLRGAAPAHAASGVALRIVLMLAVIPLQVLAGALIFFTPTELYPIYTLCGRAFAGIDALQDQQMGGLILWISGAMMSVAGIVLVVMAEGRHRHPGAAAV